MPAESDSSRITAAALAPAERVWFYFTGRKSAPLITWGPTGRGERSQG